MNSNRQRQVDDAVFERLARLVRAANLPVDAETAQASRAQFLEQLERKRRVTLWRRLTMGLVLAATAAGATTAVLLFAGRAPEGAVSRDSGEVARAPAEAPAVLAGPGGDVPVLAPGTLVRFRDGSEIELLPDGRARLAEVSDDGARVSLEEGGLRVQVTPRPPATKPGARWIFQAGPFQVHVKGTAFRIRWQSAQGLFELEMLEGEVLATGPRFSREVVAGERLFASRESGLLEVRRTAGKGSLVRAPAGPASAERARAAPGALIDPTAPAGPPVRRAGARASLPAPPPSWSQLLARGDLAGVLAVAEAEGFDRALKRRDEHDLAALGTAARLERRFDVARRVFRAQRVRFSDRDTGREAAFYLGRLAEDVDGDAASAVAWYDQYLQEGAGGALVAEALGRKMEAVARLPGGQAAARAAAREYLQRFPDGPRRDQARRLLAGHAAHQE